MDADKALYCNGIAVVQMRSMTKRIVLLFLLCALLVTADVRASQCPKDYWIVEEQIVAWAQSLADKVSGQQRYSKLARFMRDELDDGEAITVYMYVNKNGQIADLRLTALKSHSKSDRASLDLIRNAVPLPSPPNPLASAKVVIISFRRHGRNVECSAISGRLCRYRIGEMHSEEWSESGHE